MLRISTPLYPVDQFEWTDDKDYMVLFLFKMGEDISNIAFQWAAPNGWSCRNLLMTIFTIRGIRHGFPISSRKVVILRRPNRIKTIHGSLAIEQNPLSLEQVTPILNGKVVLAPPKDIAEVKNAYKIYERLDELNLYSVDDVLTAHGIMT